MYAVVSGPILGFISYLLKVDELPTFKNQHLLAYLIVIACANVLLVLR
jgi:hypothetical protein